MKVKTDYVPNKSLNLFTPGKVYTVKREEWAKHEKPEDSGGWVLADNGEEKYIYVPESNKLDNYPWTVVSYDDECNDMLEKTVNIKQVENGYLVIVVDELNNIVKEFVAVDVHQLQTVVMKNVARMFIEPFT